jgi:protein XagA
MRRIVAALLFVCLIGASRAEAGAWTQSEGATQIITDVTYSSASESFSSSGVADKPVAFSKLWSSIWAEYGWNNDLTLILSPEFASARTANGTAPASRASDFAYGAGIRYRITNLIGVLSLQATVKTAGAFDMSVAVDDKSGEQGELRLLYGTNFTLFHRQGYFDAEVAERWIAGARPNETPVDLTLGYHVLHDGCLMLQSFNVISGGDARPPYTYYRSHKMELSWVTELRHGISIQSGSFFSPTGRNALDEKGVSLALWLKF